MSRALLILAICFIGAVFSQYPIAYQYSNLNLDPKIQFVSVISPNEIYPGRNQKLSLRVGTLGKTKITQVVIAISADFQRDNLQIETETIIYDLPLNEVNSGNDFEINVPFTVPGILPPGDYLVSIFLHDEKISVNGFVGFWTIN